MDYASKHIINAFKKEKLEVFHGKDGNKTDAFNQNALFYAVKRKSLALVHFFIKEDVNVHQINHQGENLVHMCAHYDFESALPRFMNAGVSFDEPNKLGITPLMLACQRGAYNIVLMLLEAGVDVEATDQEGHTALFYAVRSKKHKLFLNLIKYGANLFHLNHAGETLHHEVARYGLNDMLDTIIEHKLSPYILNQYQQSPLHLGIKNADETMLDTWLAFGVDPFKKDKFNQSPYDLATYQGHIKTKFERFLNNPKIQHAMKSLPLHRALRNANFDQAEAMIKMGLHCETKDYFGNKPLFYVLLLQDKLLLRLLLKRISNTEDIDAFNHDALWYVKWLKIEDYHTFKP